MQSPRRTGREARRPPGPDPGARTGAKRTAEGVFSALTIGAGLIAVVRPCVDGLVDRLARESRIQRNRLFGCVPIGSFRTCSDTPAKSQPRLSGAALRPTQRSFRIARPPCSGAASDVCSIENSLRSEKHGSSRDTPCLGCPASMRTSGGRCRCRPEDDHSNFLGSHVPSFPGGPVGPPARLHSCTNSSRYEATLLRVAPIQDRTIAGHAGVGSRLSRIGI